LKKCVFLIDGKCDILRDGEQCKTDCKFCKTFSDLSSEKRKASERLMSLPDLLQRGISYKYYNGGRPWRKTN